MTTRQEHTANKSWAHDSKPGRSADRRQYCRTWLDGVATAFELKGDHFGEIHTLSTVDYSESGMGASSTDAVRCGTFLSIGFQDPGHGAKFGAVIRCERDRGGFRLGVSFE